MSEALLAACRRLIAADDEIIRIANLEGPPFDPADLQADVKSQDDFATALKDIRALVQP